MKSPLDDRVLGQMGVSIATSLALEGLYNIHPDKPKEKTLPALQGEAVFINVRTLFRNIWGSIPADEASQTLTSEYYDVLEQELHTLTDALDMQEHPLKVYFYAPTYDSLIRQYQNGELKDIKTETMTHKTMIENALLEQLAKDYKETDLPIIFNDLELETKVPLKAFIITHYPIDLLHTKGFNKVLLLESHTGVIKGPDKWYTKLAAKKLEGIERIPFNKATIQFFGDTGNMFKSQPIKAKKAMVEVAKKYHWNQSTTKDRILATLKLAFEGMLEQNMRKLWN